MIDASARPTLAQTLELEVSVQEYCVAAMRESMQSADGAQAGEVRAPGAQAAPA